jgi:hypothetical protein
MNLVSLAVQIEQFIKASRYTDSIRFDTPGESLLIQTLEIRDMRYVCIAT